MEKGTRNLSVNGVAAKFNNPIVSVPSDKVVNILRASSELVKYIMPA